VGSNRTPMVGLALCEPGVTNAPKTDRKFESGFSGPLGLHLAVKLPLVEIPQRNGIIQCLQHQLRYRHSRFEFKRNGSSVRQFKDNHTMESWRLLVLQWRQRAPFFPKPDLPSTNAITSGGNATNSSVAPRTQVTRMYDESFFSRHENEFAADC